MAIRENRQLTKAKSAKNDEFYTQYNDIQQEVNAYLDFNPDTFRGKTVLLPCDDPEWSKFTRFFAENFERLGLKKLISTSYAAASKKVKAFYQPTLFETESPQFDLLKTEVRGKIFVLDHDTNANGRIDLDDLEWRHLEGDGDQYPLRTDYDTAGRKTRGLMTRDGGASWDETRWEFDPASGVNTAKVYADCSRIAYDYTDNGRKTRTTWARGVWRENAYNSGGLVSGVTYSDATPSVSYTYDQSRQLFSAVLADGTSTTYAYDDRLLCTNEVASVSGGDTLVVARTYDDYRRPSTTSALITNVAHAAKTRFYDEENRVSGYALTNAAGRGVAVALAYDGSYLTNTVYTLPTGSRFCVKLQCDPGRRNLVTRRDYTFNGNSIYWYSTDVDLLGRPTNAVDSVSIARIYLYNRRSELGAAQIGTNSFSYAYDTIGNRTADMFNGMARSYAANNLNQYSSISTLRASAPPCEPVYDADGNLTQDDRFVYTYDAENRLISVVPRIPVEGSFAVENRYSHKNSRVWKIVRRYTDGEWTDYMAHYFTYDGVNIVLERITFADGSTRTIEYFWGNDLSGTEQGAGNAPVAKRSGCLSEANPKGRKGPRVGGLVAVSVGGAFFIPCYGHNGNVVCYVSETGAIAAQYVYDPYGNVIEQYGTNPDRFNFGFSTKYHDRETGMLSYQRRFYRPDLGRWLNRDPIEEEGGENLYECGMNALPFAYDSYGFSTSVIKHLPGAEPDLGWTWSDSRAETHWKYPSYQVVTVPRGGGKIGFRVTIDPPITVINIYFRNLSEYFRAMAEEQQHIDAIIRYDNALTSYKHRLEGVCECPDEALKIFKQETASLEQTYQREENYHAWLDSPGGPHGHH